MKLESGLDHNMARKIREKLLMKKADLARKAGISSLPIDPARGIPGEFPSLKAIL